MDGLTQIILGSFSIYTLPWSAKSNMLYNLGFCALFTLLNLFAELLLREKTAASKALCILNRISEAFRKFLVHNYSTEFFKRLVLDQIADIVI